MEQNETTNETETKETPAEPETTGQADGDSTREDAETGSAKTE